MRPRLLDLFCGAGGAAMGEPQSVRLPNQRCCYNPAPDCENTSPLCVGAKWRQFLDAGADTGTELAWAAGFFDGEGSVSAHIDKRPGRRPGLQLDIEQTDERPLRRFQEAIGHGRITQRAARAVNRKPLYRLHMSDAHTRLTLAKMWPWLSEPKKEQVARALRVIEAALR